MISRGSRTAKPVVRASRAIEAEANAARPVHVHTGMTKPATNIWDATATGFKFGAPVVGGVLLADRVRRTLDTAFRGMRDREQAVAGAFGGAVSAIGNIHIPGVGALKDMSTTGRIVTIVVIGGGVYIVVYEVRKTF